jgi:integrase
VSRPLPDGPLMTPKEAAAKLGVSVKNLMGHVEAGRLRFINIGTMHRKVHRFTSYIIATAGTWNALVLLTKHFGPDKRLDEVTDGDVAGLVAWRRGHMAKRRNRPIAPATVNRSVVEPLRKLFIRARVVWRYSFPREPLWRNHRLKEPTERVRELHASESAALDGALRSDFEPWFRFASATGLRLAETLITWDCVNWEARAIATTGKGGRMVRTPLTEAVAAILEPLKGHHPEAVFTYVCRRPKAGHRKGERLPLTYAGAKSEWQAMRKRAGVKGFHFHDVRHDFATKLLRETGNLKLVSRALNHTDVKTTARYAHVVDSDLSEALQRLSQSKSPTQSPTPKIEIVVTK